MNLNGICTLTTLSFEAVFVFKIKRDGTHDIENYHHPVAVVVVQWNGEIFFNTVQRIIL